MPGRASAALMPNFPSSDAKALSSALIHSFKPFSFLGGGGGSPPHAAPAGSNASTSTLIAIPIAVSMEAIVMPCSLNRVRIFSASEVFLSNTLVIVSLKLVIWFFSLPFRRSMDSLSNLQIFIQSVDSLRNVFSHCIFINAGIFLKFLKLVMLFLDVLFQLNLLCYLNF